MLFEPDNKVDPATVIRLIQREPQFWRLEGQLKLRVGLGADPAKRSQLATTVLDKLECRP